MQERALPPMRDLGLTARQREVLALMMQGKSNKAICRSLDVAEPTVKNHVTGNPKGAQRQQPHGKRWSRPVRCWLGPIAKPADISGGGLPRRKPPASYGSPSRAGRMGATGL